MQPQAGMQGSACLETLPLDSPACAGMTEEAVVVGSLTRRRVYRYRGQVADLTLTKAVLVSLRGAKRRSNLGVT